MVSPTWLREAGHPVGKSVMGEGIKAPLGAADQCTRTLASLAKRAEPPSRDNGGAVTAEAEL